MNDRDLQLAVMDELAWEPGLKSSDIGVSVKDGIVSLSGLVESYPEKMAARRGAKRLSYVRAVADEIEVRLPDSSKRADADIARTAENALCWNVMIPSKQIALTVEDGWITLEGKVDWQFQRMAAEKAVSHLIGVRGISSQIVLIPKSTPADIKSNIEAALLRNAKLNAQGIKVEVLGNKVILCGTVSTWVDRDEVERIAWAAPGGCEVEDNLQVAF
jgi:osmotically-inducible protein OsmY